MAAIWEMTSTEWEEAKGQMREDAIKAWNENGSVGFPPHSWN